MPNAPSRRQTLAGVVLAATASATGQSAARPASDANQGDGLAMDTVYKTQAVGPFKVFYREAGPADAPVILLLHGYPTTSHMFRGLIPLLAARYRVVAPDLPGFGLTEGPPPGQVDYTFDTMAKTLDGFTAALGLERYALYVFDYGAPAGFRLATARPERVTAIISQNGNAYEEGLSDAWAPYRAYWKSGSAAARDACRAALTPEAIRTQYLTGADPHLVSPDNYALDAAYFGRPGTDAVQLDLIYDYRTNVALYPAWQAYFRQHKPPVLAVWGKNDIYFLPPGAEAFRRDIPDAEIRFYDTGHFALETHGPQIAAALMDFLHRRVPV